MKSPLFLSRNRGDFQGELFHREILAYYKVFL